MSARRWGLAAVALSAGVFACALLLVTAQHRARALFIDLERLQNEAKSRDVEWNRLRIELSRAAQPAYVESAARQLGLKPVDGARTVFLAPPALAAAADREGSK